MGISPLFLNRLGNESALEKIQNSIELRCRDYYFFVPSFLEFDWLVDIAISD